MKRNIVPIKGQPFCDDVLSHLKSTRSLLEPLNGLRFQDLQRFIDSMLIKPWSFIKL